MKKNNVDQVFKDRLKDYQETPDERVWESIAASLDQKKSKRRILPIWWQLGGAAAALALLLYLFIPKGSEINPTQVSDTDKQEMIEEKTVPVDEVFDNTLTEKDALAGQDKKDESQTSQGETLQEPAMIIGGKQQDQDRGVASVEESKKDKSTAPSNVVDKTLMENKQGEANLGEAESRIAAKEVDPEKVEARLSENPNAPREAVAMSEEKEKPEVLPETEQGKKSIFEAIEEQEEEVVAESKDNRWSVGPMVAPVYFNTLAEGSPIHSNFVSNTKSGNVNLSYGVGVAYQVSNKLSVRSGIHRVDYGYDTDDIRFSSSLTAATNALIDNIDYNSNSRTLVVESQTGRGVQENLALDANEVTAPNPAREGRMVQDFGYLEVPVELQYSLVDRKLGVNLIGGFSSLFLMDNSVTLVSNNTATSMGEANNINDVNFSTNFGLGVYYRFTPKMQLNLEPMFKYQLNTFSETAGNFQPFSVGVYSGLSFRF